MGQVLGIAVAKGGSGHYDILIHLYEFTNESQWVNKATACLISLHQLDR